MLYILFRDRIPVVENLPRGVKNILWQCSAGSLFRRIQVCAEIACSPVRSMQVICMLRCQKGGISVEWDSANWTPTDSCWLLLWAVQSKAKAACEREILLSRTVTHAQYFVGLDLLVACVWAYIPRNDISEGV